jgi:hypothetical protein
MHRFPAYLVVLTAALLGGCASPSIPDGYTGPTATIKDTVVAKDGQSAYMFYLNYIDGRHIETSVHATQEKNYGSGLSMEPVSVERKLPARPCRLTLQAMIVYAAPILALTNEGYDVNGEVQFTPTPDSTYIVKGELSPTYSAVWLEDDTGKVVTPKIEKWR